MDAKVESVISKINALRKIADSTHSKAEKETALAMAAKLIAQYQLEEAEIQASTGKATEEDDLINGQVIYETGRVTPWKMKLAWEVPKLNNTMALKFENIRNETSHKRGSRFRVFGRPSDIAITQYMFDYLIKLIGELSFDYVPGSNNGKRGVNPARESWCLGCVEGFIAKMRGERKAVMLNASSAAMVLVGNRSEDITEAYKVRHGIKKIRTVAPSKAQIVGTYESGFRKGQTITVNTALNTSREPNKLFDK